MTLEVPVFATAKVLVVGDVMLDRYWHGATRRISPEAPVPVVKVDKLTNRPGGAANVALNLAALGAGVGLLGMVGEDEAGNDLSESLEAAAIDAHLLASDGVETITKLRVVSRQQQLIRLDFEDGFENADFAALRQRFESLLPAHDVVVFSDYAKGTLRDVAELIGLARNVGKPVLVDPKRLPPDGYAGATLLTPNVAELEGMAGPIGGEDSLAAAGHNLIERLRLEAVLVTRGENGMTLLRKDQPELHLPSEAREVFDVTGAGDTVIALIAAGLAAGASLETAVALANTAAGIVVGRLGTAAVSAPELRRQVALTGESSHGAVNESQLMSAVGQARARGERLVMTNGVFDILHAGHVAYLEKARALGDRLIVAVNSDDSVRRIKGPGRPVNSLDRRMAVLAALNFVDWVVPFEEDTPERLICRVLPDLLVKGADYRPEDIAGGDCVRKAGGEVQVIELVDGVSTTGILRAARESNDAKD